MGGRPRLRDHPRLLAGAVGLAVGETVLVWLLAPRSAVALAPQISAPAPYDVFHDLRWLLVYHESWLGFAGEVLLFLAFRAGVTVLFVRAAWPAQIALPPTRDLVRRCATSTAVLALVLLPFAVLLFATAVFSLSWLFFVGVPVLVMLAVLVHQATVERRWWYERPARASVVPILLEFVMLTVAGAVLAVAPSPFWVPVAVLAGAGNAWCWLRVVHAVAGRVRGERTRPFVVVGVGAVLAIVLGGTAIGFAVSTAFEAARSPIPVARSRTGPPVLVVKGFNSKWDGVTRRWVKGVFRIRRFSYRGLDDRGEPRSYGRADTHHSIPELVRAMRAQVDAFRRATGRRVGIVAESEGSLVALAYLAATPHAPVRSLVVLSPLLDPGRVYYPTTGDGGWGVAAGTVLDGISALVHDLGPVDVSSDTPLFRSIVHEGPALRGLLRCPAPGVRELAVLPIDSGVSAPSPPRIGFPYTVRPAFHGGLLGDGTTADLVARTLDGHAVPTSGFWRFTEKVVQAGASPWQVPDLEPSINPPWHGKSATPCPSVRRELRAWIGAGSSERPSEAASRTSSG
ncbi:MAG TPA: hypothetical protein VFC99_12810 [Acidimicrobiia bacterium]|nr:hypothetical protein [Acidimicrobiia bacterium]